MSNRLKKGLGNRMSIGFVLLLIGYGLLISLYTAKCKENKALQNELRHSFTRIAKLEIEKGKEVQKRLKKNKPLMEWLEGEE